MIKNITILLSVLVVSLLQADVEDNNITFNFTSDDVNVTISSVTLAQNSKILTATNNICDDGVTSKGESANGEVYESMQCITPKDITLSNNTITLKSGRSSNKDIGTIITHLVPYGNAMNSYSDPFTTTFNKSCQMTSVQNNPPQELNFLFNVDMTFDVNNTTVTCNDIAIGQSAINTPTIKGLYQTANSLDGNGTATYNSGKSIYSDPKSKAKWKTLGNSVVSTGKVIGSTVKDIQSIHNVWWILPGSDNDGYTLQPNAGPRWLFLTNQNYKTAIECNNNHTLFITYSDKNSSVDEFFMQFLQH